MFEKTLSTLAIFSVSILLVSGFSIDNNVTNHDLKPPTIHEGEHRHVKIENTTHFEIKHDSHTEPSEHHHAEPEPSKEHQAEHEPSDGWS